MGSPERVDEKADGVSVAKLELLTSNRHIDATAKKSNAGNDLRAEFVIRNRILHNEKLCGSAARSLPAMRYGRFLM
jgi:hypothetical protein